MRRPSLADGAPPMRLTRRTQQAAPMMGRTRSRHGENDRNEIHTKCNPHNPTRPPPPREGSTMRACSLTRRGRAILAGRGQRPAQEALPARRRGQQRLLPQVALEGR